MAEQTALHIPWKLRRGARPDEDASIDSAVWLIERMCRCLGLADLGSSEVLDVGCGVKFTQAFISRSVPIKRYLGIDVSKEIIEFLRQNIDDPRLEYHHIDTHNALYNPGGEPLSEETTLPVGKFDVICLFSVFTHLAPDDHRTMLKLLRRHIKADGRLFYTLYIDERTEAGHGLMDAWTSAYFKRHPEATEVQPIEGFIDLDRRQPLKWALYSKRYAHELIDGTGWTVLELSPPDVHIQHHFTCAPA